MTSKEILNSHSVDTLRKEVSKANIKGYSKMKKKELIELMLKTPERFSHIKPKQKKPRAKPAPKPAPKPRHPAVVAYENRMRRLIPGITFESDVSLIDINDNKALNKEKKRIKKELKDNSLGFEKERELKKQLKNIEERIIINKNTFPKFSPDINSLKDMKKWLKILKWKLEHIDKFGSESKDGLRNNIKWTEEQIKKLTPPKK